MRLPPTWARTTRLSATRAATTVVAMPWYLGPRLAASWMARLANRMLLARWVAASEAPPTPPPPGPPRGRRGPPAPHPGCQLPADGLDREAAGHLARGVTAQAVG